MNADDFHEFKSTQMAKDAQQDEQIRSLFKTVDRLYKIVMYGGLLMLLALIYGAIGPHGFNAVTKATPHYPSADKTISFAIPFHNDLDRWFHARQQAQNLEA